jgi:hypothetical protein
VNPKPNSKIFLEMNQGPEWVRPKMEKTQVKNLVLLMQMPLGEIFSDNMSKGNVSRISPGGYVQGEVHR